MTEGPVLHQRLIWTHEDERSSGNTVRGQERALRRGKVNGRQTRTLNLTSIQGNAICITEP